MLNAFFHLNQLDESNSHFRVALLYFLKIFIQILIDHPICKQHSAAYDLGLHCVLMSQEKDARLKWAKLVSATAHTEISVTKTHNNKDFEAFFFTYYSLCSRFCNRNV